MLDKLIRSRRLFRLLLFLLLSEVLTVVRLIDLCVVEDHLVGLAKAEGFLLALWLGLRAASISNA